MEASRTALSWKTYALLALTVGVIATVTTALVLTDTPGRGGTLISSSTSTSSSSVGTATVADNSLGIELVLSVNPSQGPVATSFEVNATVWNMLSRPNNVTGVNDYHGVQFNPLCNNGPVTFEVLSGYYTAANFTLGAPIIIHGVQNMMCIVPTSALSFYVFQANSDVFMGPIPQEQGMGAPASMTTRWATAADSLVNVYSSGFASPEPFPAGMYTIVAADNWGQLAAVHFTVAS